MAKSDLKPAKYTGTRGGGGFSRASYSTSYVSAESMAKSRSNTLYDQFESAFRAADYSSEWLVDGLSNHFLYAMVHDMVWRYSIHDWAFKRFDDPDDNDGRVRRLVVKECSVDVWRALQERASKLWEARRMEKEVAERAADEERANQRAAFQAEQLILEQQYQAELQQEVRPIADVLTTDMATTLANRDKYGMTTGDWVDSAVDCITTGDGFGAEVQTVHGLKLQITLSLDMSNSNTYNYTSKGNRVSDVSAKAFQHFHMALSQMALQYSGALFFCGFTFADDGWSDSQQGKSVKCLHVEPDQDATEVLSQRVIGRNTKPRFGGSDTWFYPLFEAIEVWENKHSDPSCARLDLILTDAVIEHKNDIIKSSIVQERRNGNLQTILLNFLPEHEWVNSTLPKRCAQYPINEDNLGGTLTTLIAEFVAQYA